MSRVSIEVTPEEHQRLKAVAALHGKSIKDYVMERVLPPETESDNSKESMALKQLKSFLGSRIRSAKHGNFSSRSPEQILKDIRNATK